MLPTYKLGFDATANKQSLFKSNCQLTKDQFFDVNYQQLITKIMFENAKKTQQIIKTVSAGAQLIAALTSSFIVWAAITNQLPESWPASLKLSITVCCVLIFLGIVELFPKNMLPVSLDMLFTGRKTKLQVAFIFMTLVICLLLQSGSMWTSYNSKDIIANAIIKAPNLPSSAKYLLRRDSIETSRRAKLNDEIEKAKSTQTNRIAEAEHKSRTLINDALSDARFTPAEITRYWSGHAGLRNIAQKRVGERITRARKLIQDERDLVHNLEVSKNQEMSDLTAETQNRSHMINLENGEQIMIYKNQRSRYTGFAKWFGIGGTLVFILMQILASVHRRATGLELIILKDTPPPLMYAIMQVFTRLQNEASRRIYQFAEKEKLSQSPNIPSLSKSLANTQIPAPPIQIKTDIPFTIKQTTKTDSTQSPKFPGKNGQSAESPTFTQTKHPDFTHKDNTGKIYHTQAEKKVVKAHTKIITKNPDQLPSIETIRKAANVKWSTAKKWLDHNALPYKQRRTQQISSTQTQ